MPELLSTVVAELRDLPLLDGAACYGRGPLWDAELPGEDDTARAERHQRAAQVCKRCPARCACAAVAARYRPGQLDGVWAGQNRSTPRQRGPRG